MNLMDEKLQLVSQSTVLLDTNLQVLEIVGNVDPGFIRRHKRTRSSFDIDDYELLTLLLDRARDRVTTPHILAEVSNLLRQGAMDRTLRSLFRLFSDQISSLRELYVQAVSLVEDPSFFNLGITDTAILRLETADLVVLSQDLGFCTELAIREIENINLNHLRNF